MATGYPFQNMPLKICESMYGIHMHCILGIVNTMFPLYNCEGIFIIIIIASYVHHCFVLIIIFATDTS